MSRTFTQPLVVSLPAVGRLSFAHNGELFSVFFTDLVKPSSRNEVILTVRSRAWTYAWWGADSPSGNFIDFLLAMSPGDLASRLLEGSRMVMTNGRKAKQELRWLTGVCQIVLDVLKTEKGKSLA